MKELDVTITVVVPDDADPNAVGASVFDTLNQYADENLVTSVEDWKVNHA